MDATRSVASPGFGDTHTSTTDGDENARGGSDVLLFHRQQVIYFRLRCASERDTRLGHDCPDTAVAARYSWQHTKVPGQLSAP